MAAPFVALVPTGPPSAASQCSSSPPGTDVRVPNVDNNVHALIAVGLFAFLAIAVVWALEKDTRIKAERGAVVGYFPRRGALARRGRRVHRRSRGLPRRRPHGRGRRHVRLHHGRGRHQRLVVAFGEAVVSSIATP
jgi:hypothetical protein